MRRYLLCLLIPLTVFVGCETEEPEPEEPPPPPPPTAQELGQKAITATGVGGPVPPTVKELPPGTDQQFLANIQQQKNQLSSEVNGAEAIRILSRRLEERLLALEEIEYWEHVKVLCDAYEILNPGSKAYAGTKERAMIELRKPKVKIGMLMDHGNGIVGARLQIRVEGVEYNEMMTKGEIKHGIRFDEIIGNQRGIKFTYLETGEPIVAERGAGWSE